MPRRGEYLDPYNSIYSNTTTCGLTSSYYVDGGTVTNRVRIEVPPLVFPAVTDDEKLVVEMNLTHFVRCHLFEPIDKVVRSFKRKFRRFEPKVFVGEHDWEVVFQVCGDIEVSLERGSENNVYRLLRSIDRDNPEFRIRPAICS